MNMDRGDMRGATVLGQVGFNAVKNIVFMLICFFLATRVPRWLGLVIAAVMVIVLILDVGFTLIGTVTTLLLTPVLIVRGKYDADEVCMTIASGIRLIEGAVDLWLLRLRWVHFCSPNRSACRQQERLCSVVTNESCG
jgi:hypothetical protein